MTKKKRKDLPGHCLHRPTGLGYVRLNGRMLYTGKFDTEEATAKFERLVMTWLAAGRELPQDRPDPSAYLIRDLVADYILAFEEEHEGSRQPDTLRYAVKPLLRLFGNQNVAAFKPSELKALRRHMIEDGLGRSTINMRITMLKAMFLWGVEEERVHPDVASAIRAVKNLGRRSAGVKQPRRVQPVPNEDVEAVLKHVSRPVAAMIQVQRLTGMRPGEVVTMRGADIDTTTAEGQPGWEYRPQSHKNQWRHHERVIPIGPKARHILEPFLRGRPSASFLFSPKEAEKDRRSKMRAERASKEPPSQAARRKKARLHPKSRVSDRYDVHSYRRAIQRACVKAEVPPWTPHQLRHSAATEIRRLYGVEASRTVLGHSSLDATAIYAQPSLDKARSVMEEIG